MTEYVRSVSGVA